ncbi:uncharacterized protein C1orf109-like [Gigantopelta aegis]|uniref:uncharacterized protein C1orf109-like n=1 Tax=Gigantopelta aegis TaxID=1735272 RepID=UPI001B8897DC|nr:uncharacterized protein C1orf109-like [Gigantopelta aegis]XP_041376006.1 uncharacterized protein C1orf109-like [Gigantopelta aegis]XP_041376007.1 uncharacterized protein C1orf109-like [Gigantopelta aegis]XP_041376008.1 uncharacterized protein C1orf109-like [Gigantopelta aegis]XP_041376010.1 uncharacterized protein C1orf109-like [Gigantopelta aegis]
MYKGDEKNNQYLMSRSILRKHLQKSFCMLQQVTEIFKTTLAECTPQISGLVNLCEQHTSCCNVRVEALPFAAKFPDVKERLLFKLGVEINDRIECMKSQICLLKYDQEKLKKQLDVTMKTYNKYSSDLDTDTMTYQTAVSPSMAEMLEWLTTAEKLLYVQYHMKEHLLDNLVSIDISKHENLFCDWCKGDTEMFEMIQDYLCCVSFVLEEEIYR